MPACGERAGACSASTRKRRRDMSRPCSLIALRMARSSLRMSVAASTRGARARTPCRHRDDGSSATLTILVERPVRDSWPDAVSPAKMRCGEELRRRCLLVRAGGAVERQRHDEPIAAAMPIAYAPPERAGEGRACCDSVVNILHRAKIAMHVLARPAEHGADR